MNSQHRYRALWGLAAGVALAFFAGAPLAAQETGVVQGQVVDEANRPVQGAQIQIVDTQRGTITDAEGRFRVANVQAGERQVRAQRIGYRTLTQPVTVVAGQTATLNFTMAQAVVDVEAVVVTGVAGETPRAKLPFTVDRLDAEALPVPAIDAGSAIQGKVAGAQVVRGSGRPGAAPSILLRGPTSINASGRDQEPLYIVDGVILGASMIDIDGMDIESVEVVKGAAAASLYGSRAANGVIQITTRRGRQAADDQVRYTVRSEFGRSELPGRFPLTQRHQFAMTQHDGQVMFVDADGNPCTWLECESVVLAGQWAAPGESPTTWNTVQNLEWPGVAYDQVARFFDPGNSLQNYISAEGRSGGTNYHVSYSNLHEEGVMPGQDGFRRNNFRVNIDQAVRDNLSVSASTFLSRSNQDHFPESQGNPLFNLTRMPAGVDLMATDEDGEIIIRPDPHNENANPLYEMLNRQYDQQRNRFLGSANVRYSPLAWLDIDGNVSYDRLDNDWSDFYPRGFQTARPSSVNLGHVYKFGSNTEALNSSLTGTIRQTFGNLNTRTQLRYLFEQQDYESQSGWGYDLGVAGVPTLTAIRGDNKTIRSYAESVRSEGFFLISNFDFLDRYIFDALVRRDGSSLFGADQRWQTYYRGAFAWRLTEEPWFQMPALNELKLRYSLGTAGGRPNFAAQYETYSVVDGRVTPQTLGNRNLRPEFAIEQEFGVDIMALDRLSLNLTYAQTEARDQILNVPLAAATGYSSRWINAGTLNSNTFEASLDAQLIQTPEFSWTGRILFDRTRQEITQLDIPDFTYGVAGQAMGDVFYAREGEALGTFYGVQLAQECAHLPAGVREFCGTHFAVNDDGYLVFVGENGSLGQRQWGEAGTVGGRSFMWGAPVAGVCQDAMTGDDTTFCPLGNTMPDYSLSFSSTMNWRGFSLYGLLDAVQGFEVYNQPLQWATFQDYSGIMDQSGVPEDQQKPIGYYSAMYHALGPNTAWVEDASFVKLRELSLRYRMGQDVLGGLPGFRVFDGLTLSLSGRNLATWTDYRGYDPEVGRTGGTTGSAALARVDGYNYPNYRTWTLGVEVNF